MARLRIERLDAVQRDLLKRARLVRQSSKVALGAGAYVLRRHTRHEARKAAPEHMQKDKDALKKWELMFFKYARTGRARRISGDVIPFEIVQRGAKYVAIEHGGDYRQYILSYPRRNRKRGGFHAVQAHSRYRRGFPAQKIWARLAEQRAGRIMNATFARALHIAVHQNRVPRAVECRGGV